MVKVSGLPGAFIGEGVTFEAPLSGAEAVSNVSEDETHGRVMSLEKDLAEILVLSRSPIAPGTRVARTGMQLTVSCGVGLLGHTLNTLGYIVTGARRRSALPEKRRIEGYPKGISSRERVSRFCETGVAVVDLLVPLGLGQRELIIGDRKTGKTHFLLQALLSQAKQGRVCIYCAIGKRKSEVKIIEEFLRKENVFRKVIIVVADAHSSPGEIFLAPYTAMTLAEFFRDCKKDVFLILDDLTTHAKFYREISLLIGRFPGREAYPGDIFYVHSKLLERAGCFKVDKGSAALRQGSERQATITCLPVAESVASDLTGYIQTNLMSMTDGHIYFDNEIFFQGRRPATNIFLSVTRVGRQTQLPLFRDISGKVITSLKKYEEAQNFLRFGAELGPEIKSVIGFGDGFMKFINQVGFEPIPISLQAVMVSLLWQGFWDGEGSGAIIEAYSAHPSFRKLITGLVNVNASKNFEGLNVGVRREREGILKYFKKSSDKNANIKDQNQNQSVETTEEQTKGIEDEKYE